MRARWALSSRPRLVRVFIWVSIIALAATSWAAIAGALPVAVAVGLLSAASYWAYTSFSIPGSDWSYFRTSYYALQQWGVSRELAYLAAEQDVAKRRDRVEALRPPAGFEAQHQELVESLADLERGADQRRRANRLMGCLIEETKQPAPDYSRSLASIGEHSRAAYDHFLDESERATKKLIRRLSRVHPPGSLADLNARLLAAADEYLSVLAALRRAADAKDEAGRGRARADGADAIAEIQNVAELISERVLADKAAAALATD
jgi:hypothetical protein